MHEAVLHSAARFAVSRDFCRILEKTYAGTDWQYLPNMLGGNFEQDFEFPEKTIKKLHLLQRLHLRHLKGHDLPPACFCRSTQNYPQLKLTIGGAA